MSLNLVQRCRQDVQSKLWLCKDVCIALHEAEYNLVNHYRQDLFM